ncbi:MAG: TonB-dependent receptor, partial [Sphingomonadales bacterium]
AYAYGAVTLRTAAYRGWRLPTLNELYRPFRAGADATAANAALNPERLSGVEAGIDWRPLPAFTLRATVYWNRLTDGIANVFVANGPGTFPQAGFVSAAGVYRQRRNLPRLDARGIEIDARYEAGRFSAAASYAYVDSRVGALQPAQTARHQASATLGWDTLSLTARYAGPQFEDDQNLRRLKGAVTLDAAAALPLTRNLAVEARAENITDARIEAGISGPGVIERASPRTLWLGLRLRLR